MLFDNLIPQHPITNIAQVVEQATPEQLSSRQTTASSERVNPWARIGRKITPTNDPLDAMRQAGLDWTAEKIGVRTDDLAPVPGLHAIRRSDNGVVLGIVGKNYFPCQNSDAFALLRNLSSEGNITFETAGSFERGAIVWVQARLPDLQIRLGDDISETMMFISNGHAGARALTVSPTSFRITCSNKLRMAIGEHAEARRHRPGLEVGWTVRHTRGMNAAMADIQEAYARTLRSHKATKQAFEYLASKAFTDHLKEEFFARVFDGAGKDESDRAATIAKNRRERLEMILAGPTSQVKGTRGTTFALLNSLTEYVDHERSTRVSDDRDPDESRLISATYGSGAELKEKAWSTILDLAKA